VGIPYDMASAELATAKDAVAVCGYGEMGQRACEVLADAEGVGGSGPDDLRDQVSMPGAWGTQFIAFDRNPSRVAIGLAKQVRVVYGDGASPELIRAAGISEPRAIVVTYANDQRCLEATRRLREAYPDSPIYVRGGTALVAETLLEAGATEVVVEAVEATVRFASLLGVGVDTAALLRREEAKVLPYSKDKLETLAAECGLTYAQVCRLYDGFATLKANDEGEVELSAIRDMLRRVSMTPIDDEALNAWMVEADSDGNSSLSFEEYVRLDARVDAGIKAQAGAVANEKTAKVL